MIGNWKLLPIDEVQQVGTIGLTVKSLTDTALNFRVIAASSAAFKLSGHWESKGIATKDPVSVIICPQ